MERLRRAEETRLKGLLKQQEVLKAEQFKRSQKLFELRSAERELISDISGGQGQNKNLAARISALDEQVGRIQGGLERKHVGGEKSHKPGERGAQKMADRVLVMVEL